MAESTRTRFINVQPVLHATTRTRAQRHCDRPKSSYARMILDEKLAARALSCALQARSVSEPKCTSGGGVEGPTVGREELELAENALGPD